MLLKVGVMVVTLMLTTGTRVSLWGGEATPSTAPTEPLAIETKTRENKRNLG
jgi:hypothetical protein